jgi:GNAT superfamily N-acetyltransferase
MSDTSAPAVAIRELLVGDIHLAHQAMRDLRGAYASQQQFSDHVDGVLRPAGYRLVGAFIRDHESAVAIAGFRTGDSLAWGHYLYVDDLSTARDARRRGHAGALLDWLSDEARRLGCKQLHLRLHDGRRLRVQPRLHLSYGKARRRDPAPRLSQVVGAGTRRSSARRFLLGERRSARLLRSLPCRSGTSVIWPVVAA